jgi:hypothetical protein
VDYPLENLGPDRFQQLCQSLLHSENPDVQCFPISQSDGGRDAIRIVSEGKTNSFVVYQVKYMHKPLAESDPHKWLLSVLKQEARPFSSLQLLTFNSQPSSLHVTFLLNHLQTALLITSFF